MFLEKKKSMCVKVEKYSKMAKMKQKELFSILDFGGKHHGE
jgi:hypothetical protein